MMTKRTAESSSLPEAPQEKKKKQKCRCVCDAEPEPEAVHAPHAPATPPELFTTLIGERRKKRPRSHEDHEQHDRTGFPGHGVNNATGGVNKETEDVCVSGKFRRACAECASGACTCEMAMKECASASKSREEREKVARPDDDEDVLCAFNSFQFWRTPLPALDLSVLDSQPTNELHEDSSLKDTTEEMET